MEIRFDMLPRHFITHNHPQLHGVLNARPRRRVSARHFYGLRGWSPCPIVCKIPPSACPNPLPLRTLRSSYLASRENINPHAHTFSMTRRVRR